MSKCTEKRFKKTKFTRQKRIFSYVATCQLDCVRREVVGCLAREKRGVLAGGDAVGPRFGCVRMPASMRVVMYVAFRPHCGLCCMCLVVSRSPPPYASTRKKRAAAVALGKMSNPFRPSKAWQQMHFFRSRPTNQEWTQRVAADELECKFEYCSKDCECKICSDHRTGRKTVVGCCYCSRCRSMFPRMNCSWGHGLACEEALRSKRPRHNQ